MPTTKLGKWAMWLMLGFVILFGLSQVLYILSVAGLETRANTNPVSIIGSLLGFGAGIAAFVLSLISIIKYKERAILIYIILAISAFPVVFMIGEFAFEH